MTTFASLSDSGRVSCEAEQVQVSFWDRDSLWLGSDGLSCSSCGTSR